MAFLIEGGRVLVGETFEATDLLVAAEGLEPGAGGSRARFRFDAQGLLVLPGIVDVHGDAFERQIMPRPGVELPIDLALIETDRQLVANGITTACHGVTMSWEPGLRDEGNAARILEALDRLEAELLADTYFHLRHEIFNLDGEATILRWIAERRLKVLAFNDHMEGIVKAATSKRSKIGKMVERSGLTEAKFMDLVDRVWSRREEVPASVQRLAAAGRAAGISMMSHDDASPSARRTYRELGCAIAEFPMTEATARDAVEAGEATVFGAPNVVRGGSHTGCPAASDMVAKGFATILASDYYYPAIAQAPAILESSEILPLGQAWALVSSNPARHLGLLDRGEISSGKRSDLVLVEHGTRGLGVVATFVAGRLVFSTQNDRIRRN